MKLFPASITLAEDEGFSAKDIFGRKKLGNQLTALFSKVEDPLVVALEGQWGSGKTVFLKMWKGELQKAGFPVIYFDAFANDYFEDAFIPLAAEIVGLATSKLASQVTGREKLLKASLQVGKHLLRSGLKVGVKAATLGVVDAGEIEKDIAKEAESIFDTYVGELITKQRERKSEIETFQQALSDLPKLCATAGQADRENTLPLIVIIDELDRCRPTYALQLLERVKHFFAVPRVHFVLGVSLDQLKCSVASAYGSGIDANAYLQKFIHLQVQLLDAFEFDDVTTSSKYLHYLRMTSGLEGKDAEFVRTCCEQLERIAKQSRLSLRAIEQIFGHILRAVATTPQNHFKNEALISGLALLKVQRPELFMKAKLQTLSYEEVEGVFCLLDSKDPKYNSAGNEFESRLEEQKWFEYWWRYVSDANCPVETKRAVAGALISITYRSPKGLLSFCAAEQIDKFA